MSAAMKPLLLAAIAWVVLMPLHAEAGSAPGTGIKDSIHDFTSATNLRAYQADAAASICVFCHMQHRFRDVPTTGSTRLLWNHKSSALTYDWSDATQTQGGTTLPGNLGAWVGSTKNCLSCHDGTVSVGDLYRPSAGFKTGWVGTHVDTTGVMNVAGKSHYVGGFTGDLRNNHPVGVPYPYQSAASTYNGITTGAGVDLTDYVATPVNVKLFTDVGGEVIQGAQAGATGIECASCHDVHNKHALEEPLLRDYYEAGSGSPSQICLDCHNK